MLLLSISVILKVTLLYFLGALKFSPENFVLYYNPLSSIVFVFSLYKRGVAKDKLFFVAALDLFMPVFGFVGLFFFFLLKPIFSLTKSTDEDVYELPFGQDEFD